jgi:hypothetical protein
LYVVRVTTDRAFSPTKVNEQMKSSDRKWCWRETYRMLFDLLRSSSISTRVTSLRRPLRSCT